MTFATVTELQARLDWTLSDGEQAVAQGALEDLTEWAILHGRPTWTAANVPSMVKRLLLGAAARYMRNFEGLDTSRAGDETLVWQRRDEAGDAVFTPNEIKAIGKMANPYASTIHSAPISAYDSAPSLWGQRAGWVPSEGGTKPFPLFASEDGPW